MRLLAALFLAAAPAAPQDWSLEVAALRQGAAQSDQPFLDELQRRAEHILRNVQRAHTPVQVSKARPDLRKKLEHALGHRRMPWPPKLNARVTGTLERNGYRIEKVVFESLPGVEVAAHLYVPDGLAGPAPSILFYNGHWWTESKALPDHQAFCINMARNGFVVLSFDPFGQGERGVSTRDHRRVSSLLAGVSQQGFAEYETQCALEYLLSRREVDPERIGMTGASGGGYNTWITAALDDRIKVAVPVVGTSEFALQIAHARDRDWYHAAEHCHFVPGLLTFADNHELLAAIAPRPLLIINSTTDPGFPIGSVFDYGRKLYGTLGAAGKVAFLHDATAGHGYQLEKRKAAYGWFLKWLAGRGDGAPVQEGTIDAVPPNAPELRCFSDGRKRASGPGMQEFISGLIARQSPRKAVPPREFFGSAPPDPSAALVADRRAQRIEVNAGGGITVPAFLLRPLAVKGLLLAVDDRGKEALAQDSLVLQGLNNGWAVCGVDPRGIGELATEKRGWVAAVSLLAGDHFVWRQAGDLLAVARAVRKAAPFADLPVSVYARGHNAALAAAYLIGDSALHGPPLTAWALRDGFITLRHFAERPQSMKASFRLLEADNRDERFTAFDREIPFWYVPFNALRDLDLPELLGSSPAAGIVIDPIDGDWRPLSMDAARRLLPAKIRVAGADDAEVEKRLLP